MSEAISVTSVPEVSVDDLDDRDRTIRIIDVRDPAEFADDHVPAAENHPLAQLDILVDQCTPGQVVYVICQSGNRSLRAAARLRAAGIDARSVAGGTAQWRRNRRTIG
ncbi:rhodanese-like domain-containing protein [Gordonia hongkongensis]|uniref:rhodanese-like domain-containing protein n=1 Tax=Gordonia hongkongensis TaxID=1701090 RepID=UPI0030D181FD